MENKIAGYIYVTNQPIFKKLIGNRALYDDHVKKIKKAMLKAVWFLPILVDKNTYEVVDGQHRYEAACKLWEEGIEYDLLYILVDIKEDVLNYAKQMNATQRGWNTKAYVESFIALGSEEYLTVQQFCDNHPHCSNKGQTRYLTAATLLYGTDSISLKNGLPKRNFTPEKIAQAEIYYEQLEALAYKIDGFKFLFDSHIAATWIVFSRAYLGTDEKFQKYLENASVKYKVPQGKNKENWKNYFLEMLPEN